MYALPKAMLEQQGTTAKILPCTVTQVSPLEVTLLGGTVPGVPIGGGAYALGAANALVTAGQAPIILPNSSVSTDVYTKTQTDARIASAVANPGAISPTSVSNSGSETIAGNLTVSGDIFTPHGRSTPVTSGYVAAYINVDGRLGATASTLRVKQDIEPADTAALVEALRTVSLVRFRYIQAVEDLGDAAPYELGGIAEYFLAAGLGEYVYLDEEGRPGGINYERLTIPLIAAFQSIDERLRAAGI